MLQYATGLNVTVCRNLLMSRTGPVPRVCFVALPRRPYSEASGFVDKVTHTGQQFEKDDVRLTRFIGKFKQVNPNFAIKLIAEAPPIPKKERVVACDGGGGPTGHPKVYINLDKPGNHSCGYCGLRFYKDDHH